MKGLGRSWIALFVIINKCRDVSRICCKLSINHSIRPISAKLPFLNDFFLNYRWNITAHYTPDKEHVPMVDIMGYIRYKWP